MECRTLVSGLLVIGGFLALAARVQADFTSDFTPPAPYIGSLDDSTIDPSVVGKHVKPLVMLSRNGMTGKPDHAVAAVAAQPDIVIYSDGTVWYDVEAAPRAAHGSYSTDLSYWGMQIGGAFESYPAFKSVVLTPSELAQTMSLVDVPTLARYKERGFNVSQGPHRLLTFWVHGSARTIAVGGPLYAGDNTNLFDFSSDQPPATTPATASPAAVDANRSSLPAALVAAIDALQLFDSTDATVVAPDAYELIMKPSPGVAAQAWPDSVVQFNMKAMVPQKADGLEYAADLAPPAYYAIRAQLQRNRASNLYEVDGAAYHVTLLSTYHPRNWQPIDAGLVEIFR